MFMEETTAEIHKTRPRRGRRSRRGTDLFSAILYLTIFVMVIAGPIAIYNSVMTGMRNVQLQTLMMRTASSVESSFRAFPTYDSGSLLGIIKSRGEFSDREIYEAGGTYHMRSPFGTDMSVEGDPPHNFIITVNNLKESPCEKLLEAMIDPGRTVHGVTVNTSTVTLPYSNAGISTACSGASDGLYDVGIKF